MKAARRARRGGGLDLEVAKVVAREACSGCGACCLLDPGLTMTLDEAGFSRPRRTAPHTLGPEEERRAVHRFRAACPGVTVRAVHDAPWHPALGPIAACWRAWATDPELRFQGSSGGALSALAAWLLQTGHAAQVVGAAAAPDPRHTVPVRIANRDEVLASAGSRYAPTSIAASAAGATFRDVIIGKPCEASALRALADYDGAEAPLLLSFLCAGTPSQHATDELVEHLGLEPAAKLTELRYRGHGWPGRFVARSEDGREVSASYDEAWGQHLGTRIQWRCRICPDGVGESSDITAGDLWRTDSRGYPVFADEAGTSTLIARTPRGRAVVEQAIAAGVLVAVPIDPEEIAAVQPLHRRRRATLSGRLLGAWLAGLRPPRYRGFRLFAHAMANPLSSLRVARGSYLRARAARRTSTDPKVRSGGTE